MDVAHFATLPPLKMNVYYFMPLLDELAKHNNIEFVNFSSMYPEMIYPGGAQYDYRVKYELPKTVHITHNVKYWNPLSWIQAGFKVKNKLIHVQWWSIPLVPVYAFIFSIWKMRKKKILMTVHNVLSHAGSNIGNKLGKFLFKFPDYFIVHSKESAEQLEHTMGIAKEKIELVPMGPYTTYIINKPTKEEARKNLNIPLDVKVVLNFGSMKVYKGVDVLVKAFAQLHKKDQKARLYIVGKRWFDWKPITKEINDLGLRNNVIEFSDYASDELVELYYAAADLVVLPYTRFDSQSGPGNIALACHKPLLVTRLGGLPDLVKDAKAVVPPNNVEALGQALVTICTDDKLLKKLEADSRELNKFYAWDNAGVLTTKIYEKLVSSK